MKSRLMLLTIFTILITSVSVLAYMAHAEEVCTAYCLDQPEKFLEETTPALMIWENLPTPVQGNLSFNF